QHPPGASDRAVPGPRADATDAARLALPGRRRRLTEPLHPLRRLLAGNLARPRRHLGADRRRRRARHDAPDGVADDDALLRGLPQIVPHPVMLPSLSVASTKPEAAIVRGEGLVPGPGRGWTLAPRDRGREAGAYCRVGHR